MPPIAEGDEASASGRLCLGRGAEQQGEREHRAKGASKPGQHASLIAPTRRFGLYGALCRATANRLESLWGPNLEAPQRSLLVSRLRFFLAVSIGAASLAGAAGAAFADPEDAGGQFDLATGRYAKPQSGFSESPLLRPGYHPKDVPVANFRTADARFNVIMNRIANSPGTGACATAAERAYVREYVASHHEVENAVRANDLTYTCPDIHARRELLGFD